MKPNLKTKVAGFVVCFALTTGIGKMHAQDSNESLLPPTDINTSTSGSLLPAIVPVHQANQESQMLVPMIQQSEPQDQAVPPVVSGTMLLTPRIETEVSENGDSIEQTAMQSGSPQRPYQIQQPSAPIIVQAPYSSGTQLYEPGNSLPPIIQGQPAITPPVQSNPLLREQPVPMQSGMFIQEAEPFAIQGQIESQPQINPLSNNPLATPMSSTPNYIQASSPLPLPSLEGFTPQEPAANVLPQEDAAANVNQPVETVQDPVAMPDITEMVSPRSVMDSAISSQPAFPSDGIGQNFVQPSTNFASPVAGCNSCGNQGCSSCVGSATSACSSCGVNGCYDNHDVDKRFAACGFISRARQYFVFDVLYMTRASGEVQGINLSPIDDFDYGFGVRTTIGRRSDAANGREFSYFGSFDIEEGGTVTDPLGRISRRFIADGTFLTPADLTAFTTVTSATETHSTAFHSFEYNRVRWGWDVVKVIFGGRYVYLEDDYDLLTTTGFGETGSFSVDAKNHMFGPQAGLELFYDVGYRWSLSGFGKFGVMLNSYDADIRASANGFGITSSGTNEADMSFLVDLGITAHYQLSNQARFRLGYNLLYLGEVTTAEEAFPRVLSPFSATSLDAKDDAVFSGVSFGLEFYR